jgi:hypothetical protein
MKNFAIRGYVESLNYEDIEFVDKKSTTGEKKTVKKLDCCIRVMEDDTVVPVTFWGTKISDMFVDIVEGCPVVCAFSISSKMWKGRYFISLKGYSIERYHGLSSEEKTEKGEQNRDQNRENRKEYEAKEFGYEDPEYKGKSIDQIAKEHGEKIAKEKLDKQNSWEDTITVSHASIQGGDVPF